MEAAIFQVLSAVDRLAVMRLLLDVAFPWDHKPPPGGLDFTFSGLHSLEELVLRDYTSYYGDGRQLSQASVRSLLLACQVWTDIESHVQ